MLNAKITDFDFMKINESKFNLVERGTPEYAPEEVLNVSNEIGHYCDVYSFALIVYFVFLEKEVLAHVTEDVPMHDSEERRKKMREYYLDRELCVIPEDIHSRLVELNLYNDNIIGSLMKDEPLLKSLTRNHQIRTQSFISFFPFDSDQSIFDMILIDSRTSCNEEVRNLAKAVFDQKLDEMDFVEFLGKLKEKLRINETYLENPEDVIRKYLYLKLSDHKNINETYFKNDNLLVTKDNFLTFINLHGPSLVEYRRRNEDPLKEFFNDLVKQPWYWENYDSSRTSNLIVEATIQKKKKKNLFLIRDGMLNKETYTLEVCLGVNCFVQKISLKDIEACKNYAKQLKKSHNYEIFDKGDVCDHPTRTSITQQMLSKQSEEKGHKSKKRDHKKKKN